MPIEEERSCVRARREQKRGINKMAKMFQIGDHVGWNSEAGRVTGTIIAVHTTDFKYKGHVHHASEDDPQYEIKSDKTDHIAAHKGSALKRIPIKGAV
jgi:Hypervirulence associated proteins TUDOR domain